MQILNVNGRDIYGEKIEPINFIVLGPDTIKVKEEAIFRIASDNSNFKLVEGVFDCQVSETSLIDTTNHHVPNCKKGFIVKNDTMYIAFRPQLTGEFEYQPEIILITKDLKGVFRFHTFTFGFTVID